MTSERLLRYALLAACVAAASPAAHALSFGNPQVLSRLGQPLRVAIPLLLAPGESVHASCLSLVLPEPSEPVPPGLISTARITIETGGGKTSALVVSTRPFTEPYAVVRLRAACPGSTPVQREFTLLIDPDLPAAAPRATGKTAFAGNGQGKSASPTKRESGTRAKGTPWEVAPGETLLSIVRSIYPQRDSAQKQLVAAIVAANPGVFPGGDPDRLPSGVTIMIPDLRSVPAPAHAQAAPPPKPATALLEMPAVRSVVGRAVPDLPPRPAGRYLLKIAAGPMDLSPLGRMTEAQRSLLRERLALFDADDQIANLLALRQQVRHLESELQSIRLRLKQSEALAASPALMPAAPAGLSDGARLAHYSLTLYLLPAMQILIGVLAVFLLIRFYANIRERMARAGALAKRTLRTTPRRPLLIEEPALPRGATGFDRKVVVVTTPMPHAKPEDVDGLLHEAQLYVIHGHTRKAVELLEEQIARGHGEMRVWMLLFAIYHSEAMRSEFQGLAQRFRAVNHDPDLWRNVQLLGRELDPTNPIYQVSERARAATEASVEPREQRTSVDLLLEAGDEPKGRELPPAAGQRSA